MFLSSLGERLGEEVASPRKAIAAQIIGAKSEQVATPPHPTSPPTGERSMKGEEHEAGMLPPRLPAP
jgi:hypothetical protein